MRTLLRIIVIAGLAADAYLHFKVAKDFDFKKGSGSLAISEGLLFRVQGGVAVVAALALLIKGNRLTYAFGFLVAGSAVGALLLYHYVDVGAIGPLPNMHDPVWYTEKTQTAVSEGIGTLAALIALLLPQASRRDGRVAAHSRSEGVDRGAPRTAAAPWAGGPAAGETRPDPLRGSPVPPEPLPRRHPGASQAPEAGGGRTLPGQMIPGQGIPGQGAPGQALPGQPGRRPMGPGQMNAGYVPRYSSGHTGPLRTVPGPAAHDPRTGHLTPGMSPRFGGPGLR